MSVESKIAGRESLLSPERGSKNLLFRSTLKSNQEAAAIPLALSQNGRVQAPSGKHSNGTVVIENGIDPIRSSGLNNVVAFTGMEREPTVGACAICGRPLTQDGRCLRCLANLGFLSGSQEPGRSETARRLTPGPLKYDHFEVEVGVDGFPIELGAGAMAITYRARDTVLNSIVALKVIDRKVAKMPGVRSRFLREARLAAQIRYPNVARVTHYGEQDGECFYVMELVEGETLETRVRRDGPMPLALALEIIEQVARALAAAEACSVVHRDLKPSNIMLESDPGGCAPIVKVIDYGIAKLLTTDTARGAEQTQTGFIGTPAFASPEQFDSSENTNIDTRSDIYSLGATFWYLLSGRVPFVGRTLREVAAKQGEELPFEQLKNAHVPTRVMTLLKSMLAVDPAKRPQTARELLSAIHRGYAKFSVEALLRRKRFALLAGATALVLVAVALGPWFYQRAQSSAQLERSIAVLPFENLSADSADTYFTVGMQDEITNDLAHLAGLKVIGSQSTRSYVPGKERNLGVIGRDLSVRHLLEGTVSRDHDQMHVALHLVDLRDGMHSWAETYHRPIKDVFALQSEITHAIAAQLRAEISPNEKPILDTPPTTDLEAYDLYLHAHALSTAFYTGPTFFANGKRAMALLEQAVTRDPSFALAYCQLAKWHDDFYFQRDVGPPEDVTIDHRSLAEAALEKARRLQPNSGVVRLALARHALQINNNPEEAEIQVQLARQVLPNNAEAEAIAGRIARRQDRWDEAIRCFEKAVSLEPRDVSVRNLLALTYRYTRRYDDCDRIMQSMIDLTPPDKLGILPIERAFARSEESGDLTSLREAITTQLAAHQLDESNGGPEAQMLFALSSRDTAAMSRVLLNKHPSLSWNTIVYPDAWFEALAARIHGDNNAAVKAFAIARPEMEKRVMATPNNGAKLSVLAMIDAGLERKEQASEEGKRASELTPFKANNFDACTVRSNLAVVYAWTGQNDLAIAELSNLVDRPASGSGISRVTYGDLQLSPVWDPLRSDPRFEALVQRLAPVASK